MSDCLVGCEGWLRPCCNTWTTAHTKTCSCRLYLVMSNRFGVSLATLWTRAHARRPDTAWISHCQREGYPRPFRKFGWVVYLFPRMLAYEFLTAHTFRPDGGAWVGFGLVPIWGRGASGLAWVVASRQDPEPPSAHRSAYNTRRPVTFIGTFHGISLWLGGIQAPEDFVEVVGCGACLSSAPRVASDRRVDFPVMRGPSR